MGSDHRYQPQRTIGGAVVQSGIDARPRGARPLLAVEKRPFRAVVANTRILDEEGNVRGLSVECDVILVQYQLAVQGAQVMQRQHGVNHVHDLWIPRPSTRVVGQDGTPLNLNRTISRRGSFIGPFTPLGDVDGDHVLLDFIEGNPDYPIIVGALPHERSNRYPRPGDGWREGDPDTRGEPRRDEFYTHHFGAEVRINEQGDLLIDTVGAYSDIATEDTGVSSGQVRIRVKDSQRFTVAIGNDEDVFEVWKDGGQLRIDLGEGATQRLVLGDDHKAAFDSFRTALTTWIGLVKTAIEGVGGTLVNTAFETAITQLGTDMGNALSDLAKTKKT